MARHHYQEIKFLRRGERLRDFIFGYNDGAVTTLAVIVALTVAGVDNLIIILGAFANIFGAGIAFTLGDYVSVKSQMNFMKTYLHRKLNIREKEEVKDMIAQFDSPAKIALMAFIAFVVAGSIAILPFFFAGGMDAMVMSITMVFLSVFFIGLYKSKYTNRDMLRSGAEMVVIAALALAAAFFIGTYGLSVLGAL